MLDNNLKLIYSFAIHHHEASAFRMNMEYHVIQINNFLFINLLYGDQEGEPAPSLKLI